MCGVLAGLGAGSAHATDAQGSKRRDLALAPISFLPANNAANYAVDQGGLGRLCLHQGSGYFVARLPLEDGAVIERITAFLIDESPDAVGMMSLARRDPDGFEVLALTPVSKGSGDTEALSTEAISRTAGKGPDEVYLLQVLLTGPAVCLRGAQVTYRVP